MEGGIKVKGIDISPLLKTKNMERIKILKSLFNRLSSEYSLEGSSSVEGGFLFLMHLKISIMISRLLYDNNKKRSYPDIVMGEYAGLLYEGYSIEDDLDYISQSKLTCSFLPDYVLVYMYESPFWDVKIANLYVDDFEDYLDKDEKGDSVVGEKYIRRWYGDFFEEEVYASEELFDKITSFYYVGSDFTDDLCVIKSSLFPYLDKFKKAGEKEYPEEIRYLEEAYNVIGAWMMGVDDFFQTEKNGYFFSTDNSDESLGYGEGCIVHNRAIVVAAELIEEIMFYLDNIYHIFPEDITGKEELWEKKKKSFLV